MKHAWQLERVRPGDEEIRFRNPRRSLRWLWALVGGDRDVSIAGCRVRYTPFEESRGEPIERKIPGGRYQTIAPGSHLSISLSKEREDPEDGAVHIARGRARPGDTIEVYDDRNNLAQARVVIGDLASTRFVRDRLAASGGPMGRAIRWIMARIPNPLDVLNALIWHSQAWLYNKAERLWSHFQATGIWIRASSMAYNTILVVVPFTVLLLLLFWRLDGGVLVAFLEDRLLETLQVGPEDPELSRRVNAFLDGLKDGRLGVGMYLFGLLSTVLFMMQAGDHLNDMRGSPPRPKKWWLAILANILVFPGVVCVAYVLLHGIVTAAARWDVFVSENESIAESALLHGLASAGLYLLIGAAVWVVLFVAYYFVPTVRPRTGRTWWAALVATSTLAILFAFLAYLAGAEKFTLFGPFKFVAVALFGCYLGWAVFFLGAFWAYSEQDRPPADVRTAAIHVRFGILLALKKVRSQTIHELAERVGVDPALVWTEALAMQALGTEDHRPPPVRVGICSQTLEPRVSLGDSEETDMILGALGTPDLLSYLHGADPEVAKTVRRWLRAVPPLDEVHEDGPKTSTHVHPAARARGREAVVLEAKDA